MDNGQRIAGERHVQLRQRTPGTADHVEGQPLPLALPTGGGDELRHPTLEAASVAVAQRPEAKHAEWKGDALASAAVRNADQLQASSP